MQFIDCKGPVIVLMCLLSSLAKAQVISPYLTEVNYSIDIDYLNGADINVLHNQVMIDPIGTANTSNTPMAITEVRGARVDGYHIDGLNREYYSFDQDTRVNDFPVLKGDIIRCNNDACDTYTLVFNALSQSIQSVNIDAFTFDPNNGDLIFSIESPARLGTTNFLAADLIRFDGTNYSFFYDALNASLTRGSSNIDALTWLPNDRILASLANESIFHEIYELDLAQLSWSTAYTPLSLGSNYNSVNISSLMAFENDLIFKSGFEETSVP